MARMGARAGVGVEADVVPGNGVISPASGPPSVNPLAGVGLLLHKKWSPAPDVGGPNSVKISDWNDRHIFSGGANGHVLVRDSSTPDGGDWSSFPLAKFLLAEVHPDLPQAHIFIAGPGLIYELGSLTIESNGIDDEMLRDSHGQSVIGRSGTAGDPEDLIASFDGAVLRRAGGVLEFGALDLGSSSTFTGVLPAARMDPGFPATVPDNAITNIKLRDSVGFSVLGRAGSGTGDPGDIQAGTNGHVLRRSGDLVAFGPLDLASSDSFIGVLPASKMDPAAAGVPGPPGADGATGPAGPTGPAGATGAAGVGVPVGGGTGQILSKTSAADYATGWIDAPAGGGGGDALWVGPSAPTDPSIELWADTDAVLPSSGGGGWPFGPITPLDQSTWAWVNQGDALIVQANGLVYMETGVASPQNLTARVRAIPTPPYVITAAFINAVGLTTFSPRTGLCLRHSGTGQLITLAYLGGNGNFELLRFNSPFSYNGQYAARNIAAKPALAYLRLSDDGTTRRAYESLDGFNFRLLHEGSRTDFFTPDQIGIFAGRESGAMCAFSVLSWIQT